MAGPKPELYQIQRRREQRRWTNWRPALLKNNTYAVNKPNVATPSGGNPGVAIVATC